MDHRIVDPVAVCSRFIIYRRNMAESSTQSQEKTKIR